MELGLEVNPEDCAMLVILSGQDVGDKVVPIEEPPMAENVKYIENRGGVGFLNPRGGRAVSSGVRRGRRSQFCLLVRKGEDRGG